MFLKVGEIWQRAFPALFLVLILPCSVPAQSIIDARDGTITWSNTYLSGVFSVEWASDLEGTWYGDWEGLRQQAVSGAVMSAAVPLFFRVINAPLQMNWVIVSNAHNSADSTGYGAVNYTFRIGTYEVSNGEYSQFLNAVDPGGDNTLGLYSSSMATDARGGITNDSTKADGAHYEARDHMYQKPVNFVSFWDAARFVNWLHNGRGSGGTESGVYDLTALSPENTTVSRSPGARFFLPNEDEWYKAAYYDGGSGSYWLYPVRSDSPPTIGQCNAVGGISNDASHIANYSWGAVWNGQVGHVTGVGSGGAGSETYYGAADMAGNLFEWNEAIISTNLRCIRGGCWYSVGAFLASSARNGFDPAMEFNSVGFRVAGMEPSAAGAGVVETDDGGSGDDGPPTPGG